MAEKGESSAPAILEDESQPPPAMAALGAQADSRDHAADLVALVLGHLAVARGPEVDGAVQTALREMATDAGVERAYVLLLDGERFSMAYEWCAPEAEAQREALQNALCNDYPQWAGVLVEGRTVQRDRLEREDQTGGEARPMLLLPLRGRAKLVSGAVGLESARPEHRWTAADVRQVRIIGDVLVSVLERKQMEQALRASEAKLLALTNLLPDVVSIIDTSGKLVFNSLAAKRIHGYEPEDLLGKSTVDKWHPEDAAGLAQVFERLLATPGSIEKAQYRYRNKDGSYVWMEAMASNQLHHPDIQGVICLSRDISDRKREEQERRSFDLKMQQLQNLESLGVLAGGVAHDFNNLLVAILGNIDLALLDLPSDSPVREGLREATKASHRAAELARQLLAYAGKGNFFLEPVDIGQLVGEMAHALHAAIEHRASLDIRRSAGLPLIEADRSQLRQVLLNLVLNAAEATGGAGGTITISTEERYCSGASFDESWIDDHLPEGQYVLLEVSDTGCGMPPSTVARIFEPFFSTKFTGRGLGLAAVLGIIRSHKGTIRVSSEPGRGTTFSLLFPAARGATASAPRRSLPAPTPPLAGCVLLVDDEDMVRNVGKRMLESLGFEVSDASSGADALALLEQDQQRPAEERFRLVILDLTMPELDGLDTLARIRGIRPDVPVIIASGYAKSEVMLRFEGAKGVSFIQKPFALEQLHGALAGALDPAKTAPIW